MTEDIKPLTAEDLRAAERFIAPYHDGRGPRAIRRLIEAARSSLSSSPDVGLKEISSKPNALDDRAVALAVSVDGASGGWIIHREPERTEAVIADAFAYLSKLHPVDGMWPEPSYLVERLLHRLRRVTRPATPSTTGAGQELVEEIARELEASGWMRGHMFAARLRAALPPTGEITS